MLIIQLEDSTQLIILLVLSPKKLSSSFITTDAVFDTVGGETYKRSFKVLKKGGVIVSMLEQPDSELMNQYVVKLLLLLG
jgi:NADPH:quinone reductase-like Zn-dependent oxidoreductase